MEGNKLYVGNLDYNVTNEELQDLFSSHGTVVEVNIIEGKGFGFIEMSSSVEAETAKDALNGSEFKNRSLKIDEARPRDSKPRRDFNKDRPRGGQRRY